MYDLPHGRRVEILYIPPQAIHQQLLGDGTNESAAQTAYPGTPGTGNATAFAVAPAAAATAGVPFLTPLGIFALISLLAAAGILLMKR